MPNPTTSLRCPECGGAIERLERFCPACGANVATKPLRLPPDHVAPGSVATIQMEQHTPAPAPKQAPARRRTTRRWALWVASALTVGVLIVAGFYGFRVREAFQTVGAVTTPRATISGAALGGPTDVTIDTAPAVAAVMAARETPAPSGVGEAPSAQEPEAPDTSTANASTAAGGDAPGNDDPARTAGATVPAPPQPEHAASGPVLSQIERLRNGSFETGTDGWYTEDDVSTGSGDAVKGNSWAALASEAYADQSFFLISGATYSLRGSARAVDGGSGVIGITFRDADGNRLRDSEPKPIRIGEPAWTRIDLSFTVPAGVAQARVYLWNAKERGSADFDALSLRTVVPDDVANEPQPVGDTSSMTILLMGVDARPGEPIDIGVRPDSLMVLRLDSETGSCRILSIPRDTRTELPGYGLTKINHALAVGGIPYQELVVEKLLGISIDHYILIDFDGFTDLVDAVGGITVDVPGGFTATDGQVFDAGRQTLSGKRALSYARYRGGPDGDFGRIQRQQQVLRAIVQRGSKLNLVPAVEANIRTDLAPQTILSIAGQYRDRCTDDSLSTMFLEGSVQTFDDPLFNLPLSYVVLDPDDLRSQVAALLER